MTALPLSGKTAIVTGSARENGIGAAIALALARDGADVVIHHVSPSSAPRGQKVAEKIRALGRRSAVVQADLIGPAGAKKLVADSLAALGVDNIHILVNNSGGSGKIPLDLLDATEEDILYDLKLNALGPLFVIQAVAPHMPSGGRIVNTSSIAAHMALPGRGLYGAAKATLNALTANLAAELGRSKSITVNNVAPGPVVTDAAVASVGGMDFEEACQPLVARTLAAERLGTAEDIADIVAFLASEKSRWITGQHIDTSGGINMS